MKNTRLLILAASLLACSINLCAVEAASPSAGTFALADSKAIGSVKIDQEAIIRFGDPELEKMAGGKRMSELREFVKEGVEAKASLAALQSQQQLQNLATEFYKASSEKNAALLQLVSALQQLETARTELAAARAEIETIKSAKK